MRKSLFVVTILLGAMVGCRPAGVSKKPPNGVKSGEAGEAADDLASARKTFVSNLRVRGPAPQRYENDKPPPGVKQVEYTSGDLKLKGWLSAEAGDGKKQPAVVYLHGGWAFGAGDWEDAEPFSKAGFVLFMPMLRGENGNPGVYESFLGEVDDAIAAGRFVSSLPNVDASNVFVTGHSVGSVLTCLVSMLPSPYKAAAAFDGFVDMEVWAALSSNAQVPYDFNDPREIRVRNPMAFAGNIRCPLRLYAGKDCYEINAPLAAKAKQAGKDCELIAVPGDHLAMVAPAVQKAIVWFRQLIGQDEQSQKNRTALQGEWEIVSAESNGEPPPPDLLKGARFAFSDNKLTLMGKEMTFELDASRSPRQIDVGRGQTRQIGIYELVGDRLKLCVGPADDRPKEFKTKPRTDHSLFVLKRKL